MPRRRSHYRKSYAHPAECPHCQQPLSRLSGQRYTVEPTTTRMTASAGEPVTQPRRWLEEFYCPSDGRLWMAVERDDQDCLNVTLPDPRLWRRAVGVASAGNPSVSQFSARHSRGCRAG